MLFEPIRTQIGKMIRDLARQKETEILEGHALPDHIHLLVSIPPKYSVAHIVGFLKGKSAIKMHNSFSQKRHSLMQKSFWSRGYYVSTVGINEDVIKKYIQNQWKDDQYVDGDQLDLSWN